MAIEFCCWVIGLSIIRIGIAPPMLFGVAVGDIAEFIVKSNTLGVYDMLGAESVTVILT